MSIITLGGTYEGPCGPQGVTHDLQEMLFIQCEPHTNGVSGCHTSAKGVTALLSRCNTLMCALASI